MKQYKFVVELESHEKVDLMLPWEVHSFDVTCESDLRLIMRINYYILESHRGPLFNERIKNSRKAKRIHVKYISALNDTRHVHAYSIVGRGSYIPAIKSNYECEKQVLQQLAFHVILEEDIDPGPSSSS